MQVMTPFSPNLTLLQFEKLHKASRFLLSNKEEDAPKPRGVPELGDIRSSIQSALGRQEWLLVEDQHIELPSSSLDLSRELFSLADFVIEADKAMQRDLTAAAFDSGGKRLELDDSQQLEIHETGQLSVPSALLENQTHVWQVNPWFFQGRSTIYNLFLEGVGKCIDHLAVYSWSNPEDPHPYLPSWSSSFRSGFVKAYRNVNRALRQLVSAPFRPPLHEDVEYVLSQVELAYVRYHLENQGMDSRLCDPCSLRDSVWENVTSVWDLAEECRPTTKNRKDALYAIERVTCERARYEESVQRRQLIYSEAVALESPLSARREANRATKKRKEDSLTALIDHLANQTDALFHVEAARLEARRVEIEIERSDQAELQELKKAHEARMKKKRPVLALSGAWLKRSTKTYISQQRKRTSYLLVKTSR